MKTAVLEKFQSLGLKYGKNGSSWEISAVSKPGKQELSSLGSNLEPNHSGWFRPRNSQPSCTDPTPLCSRNLKGFRWVFILVQLQLTPRKKRWPFWRKYWAGPVESRDQFPYHPGMGPFIPQGLSSPPVHWGLKYFLSPLSFCLAYVYCKFFGCRDQLSLYVQHPA